MQVSQQGMCIGQILYLTSVSWRGHGRKSGHTVFSINKVGSSEELMTGQSAEHKWLWSVPLPMGPLRHSPPLKDAGTLWEEASGQRLLDRTWLVNSELRAAAVACPQAQASQQRGSWGPTSSCGDFGSCWVFFRGMGSRRVPILQWIAPQMCTYEQC